jgi:vacuolar-type H+-ATPase subunit H
MSAKRKDDGKGDGDEAETKLGRLLETEYTLEAMLAAARREAQQLVEAARLAADDRARQFELEIEAEDRELRERVAREAERTIASIRRDSRQAAERLDGLDNAKITELALHVVDLVVGGPDSRGPR